jgi:hypothetical protein
MEPSPKMSTETQVGRLRVQEFADRFRHEVIPLTNSVSYFSAVPIVEEDLKDYLQDPVAALPPAIQRSCPGWRSSSCLTWRKQTAKVRNG